MAHTHDRWVAALDHLERVVKRQTVALEDGLRDGLVDDDLLFRLPKMSSPMPTELHARATGLLDATKTLIDRARTRSDDVRPREHVHRPRPSARPTLSHFDHRA